MKGNMADSENHSMETLTEQDCNTPTKPGVGLYFILLSVQLSGVVFLLSNLIPLYRLMATDFANYTPSPRLWWAFAGILLIQVAYWLRIRLDPSLPRVRSLVLGHIVTFIARLGFVSVTAAFTDMFLKRFDALKAMDGSAFRALVTLLVFFTIFCWTLELERLAKALQGDKDGTQR